LSTANQPPGISRLFSSFGAPGFRLYFTGSTLSAVDMNVRIAVHGWLVLELSNDSEFWVGIFALTLGMGQVLFSLFAGAIADRFQRRTVLLAESTISATLAIAIAVATFFEFTTLWMAIAIAFPMGAQRAVRFTASNRFVYDLVGARQLVNGVAMWRLSATPMMIFGALITGAMIDWQGVWAAYGVMGASIAASLPFIALVKVRGDVERIGISLFAQTVEGARFAVHSPPLRVLFTISLVMESLGFAFLIMIPVMAKTVLETGGTGMGFLQAGVGTGMLVASLLMAARGDVEHKARVIFWAALGAGVALLGFAASRSLPLSVFLAAAAMAFLNAYDMTLGALMQLVSPPHLRGRAVSLHSLAISFTALGGFVMGAMGGIIGVPVVLAAGGAGIIANSLWRRAALMRIREDRS
jgi:MFS family permease